MDIKSILNNGLKGFNYRTEGVFKLKNKVFEDWISQEKFCKVGKWVRFKWFQPQFNCINHVFGDLYDNDEEVENVIVWRDDHTHLFDLLNKQSGVFV